MSWEGRHVLVTGAGGFVGSHLVEALLAEGAKVSAWVRGGSGAPAWRLGGVDFGATEIIPVDLGDESSVQSALKAAWEHPLGPPWVIYHLGAQAHVGEAWERPWDTVRSNVFGTLSLFKGLSELDVRPLRAVVVAGSSEEYGAVSGERASSEDAPLRPRSLYAVTKVLQDELAKMYLRAFHIPSIVARSNNIYGPRQGPRYLTGTIITQLLSRDIVELGNAHSRRDYTYVADAVSAYMLLGANGTPGTYTWGNGRSWSVAEWLELCRGAVKAVTSFTLEEGRASKAECRYLADRLRPGASEVSDLVADPTKIKEELGWAPRHTPEEGLELTAAWYAANEPFWAAEVDWR